jgi:hypothetical protein
MNYLLILFLGIALNVNAFTQNIVLSGEQIKSEENKKTQLICKAIKLETSAKITKAEGNCTSFWIQKGNITIHKFNKLDKSIGIVLKPGKYTVYPILKTKQKKANIKLILTTDI